MLRLFDWECTKCHESREHLTEVPNGHLPVDVDEFECSACGKYVKHRRQVSMPAKYLGDRPMNLNIKGGSQDTMGFKPLPRLPEFKGETGKDFKEFVSTTDYKSIKKERAARRIENMVKRKRAKAIERGENISMRHTKVAGDPNWKD